VGAYRRGSNPRPALASNEGRTMEVPFLKKDFIYQTGGGKMYMMMSILRTSTENHSGDEEHMMSMLRCLLPN
jgi:hypothetical protein